MTLKNTFSPAIKALTIISMASLATLSLSSCSSFKPYTPPVTQGTIMPISVLNELQEGLTRAQVRALLGPEMGADPFDPKHSEYVFYTTDPNFDKKVLHHLILEFDEEGYLAQWKEGKPVKIKPDPFS